MFKPKSQKQTPSPNSLIPLANGENDYSVFNTGHASRSHPAIRGKGLGLGPSTASQNSLKNQEKLSSVSQKNALSDVNHKSVDVLSTNSKGTSGENTEIELFAKSKQSFGRVKNCNGSDGVDVINDANVEIGRNARSYWDDDIQSPNLISPLPVEPEPIVEVEVQTEGQVEPIIQNYFDLHEEYPEIEYITTNRPSYDADWYYYQYPEMVPETFDRSFDSMDEVDIEIDNVDLCLDSTKKYPSLSPVSMASSFDVQFSELHFDSAFDDTEWEDDHTHNKVFIPTDHPFFASYSNDDDE